MPDQAYLCRVVEPGELRLGVRLDFGRIHIVLDIELGRYPLVRVRKLGSVKDHTRTRGCASAAGEYRREEREQEEEDDRKEAHQGTK